VALRGSATKLHTANYFAIPYFIILLILTVSVSKSISFVRNIIRVIQRIKTVWLSRKTHKII